MNPLTNVKNITKLNEIELAKGLTNKKSWHDMYKDSAWIFIGGLAYGLTEGDIIAVFSQYGEIVNINLVRDKKTGKTKGFCFLCYANQKSTNLAVDNFNGIKLCNRTIRVDHVSNYKPPKEDEKDDELTKMLKSEGCAPKLIQTDESTITDSKSDKKHKKHKKEKKQKKKKRNHHSDENDSVNEVSVPKKMKIKKEIQDPGYDKYELTNKTNSSERKQSPGRDYKRFLGEGSSFQSDVMPEVNKHHHKNKAVVSGSSRHRSNSIDRERFMPKDKREQSHQKNNRKRNMDTRKHDSCRSVSSHSSSSYTEDNVRYGNESRKLKSNQRHRDPSKWSSSDDERRKDLIKEKYHDYDKKRFHQKEMDKYDLRREDSCDNVSSVRSSYHDRENDHSNHKSKYKHRNEERHDKYCSDSYISKNK